ncbi:MAG: hypothetical protein ACK4Z7_01645 [Novosphingobium sp.]
MSFTDPAAFGPAASAPGLRPLSWHGLCAQITAMQDLRRALSADREQAGKVPGASFDHATARFMATLIPGASAQSPRCEQPVNPTPSANGKDNLATTAGTPNVARTGHAEARD